MLKEVTRTVLALPQTTYSTQNSEQARSNTAFGDLFRVKVFPASGKTSATCSISVKGK